MMLRSPARSLRSARAVRAPVLTVAAAAAALAASLAGCATEARFAPVVVPEGLDAPRDESRAFILEASGVQIYECRAPAAAADAANPGAGGTATTGPAWVLRGPEATLSDSKEHVVGTHGPGLTWVATDGTRLAGVVMHRMPAPEPGALPWLLLSTTPSGASSGLFAGVRHAQRVATSGGSAPPAATCTGARAGQTERVPFDAQYWFYRKRWTW